MSAPFVLPVRLVDRLFLVAEDSELVCKLLDATPEERAYIVKAINHHEALQAMLERLLGTTELNLCELEPATITLRDEAISLVAALRKAP